MALVCDIEPAGAVERQSARLVHALGDRPQHLAVARSVDRNEAVRRAITADTAAVSDIEIAAAVKRQRTGVVQALERPSIAPCRCRGRKL